MSAQPLSPEIEARWQAVLTALYEQRQLDAVELARVLICEGHTPYAVGDVAERALQAIYPVVRELNNYARKSAKKGKR